MEGIVLSQLRGSQSSVNLRTQRERFMKINVFKNRHRSSWQRSVRSAANDSTPFIWDDVAGLHANENFPWNHLQHYTNDYLSKKKRLGKDEVDGRLVEYVQLSAENDRADMAIAACGHKLSRASLRRLLTGDLFMTPPGNVINMSPFLIAIVTANRVNPDAIDNLEAEKAKAMYAAVMMPHGLEGDWGRYVHELMKILIDGLPTHLLVYPYVMARIRQACTSLALYLQQLKDDGQFLRAYSSSQWLSKLLEPSAGLGPPNAPGPTDILDSCFPTWRGWAAWRPNGQRLKKWSAGFPNTERGVLKDFLALEGPDTNGSEMSLKDGIVSRGLDLCVPEPICVGPFDFEAELAMDAGPSIERLLCLIDSLTTALSDEVTLFRHLCVGKTITLQNLDLLEIIRATDHPAIAAHLLNIYGYGNLGAAAQMKAVMQLLPHLDGVQSRDLREHLTPTFLQMASDTMDDMQGALRRQLASGSVEDDADLKLHTFGRELFKSWLLPLLDPDIQKLATTWPSNEDMTALHSLWAFVYGDNTHLKVKMNNYYLDRLSKPDSATMITKQHIEALLEIWKVDDSSNPDLRFVAMDIAEAPVFGMEVRYYNMRNLVAMGASFCTEARKILEKWVGGKELDSACVELVRLLSGITNAEHAQYWHVRLHKMIARREVRILDYTLNNLDAMSWIGLVNTLKKTSEVLDSLGENQYRGPLLLPSLQGWVKGLGKYAAVIARLDNDMPKTGNTSAMRCLLLGGVGALGKVLLSILDLADKFYVTHRANGPAMLAVILLLRKDGGNASDIAMILSWLTKTTKQATFDACIRLIKLQQGTGTNLVAEAMLATWLQAPSRGGLGDDGLMKALASGLGIRITNSNKPALESLEAAADYLDQQFKELFIEAQRLESLRSRCKKTDPVGVSALLAKLNIEDPSPIDDFLSRLPATLLGSVEMVNDSEVEMHFPMKLTPLQQIALGVGNAKGLVVHLHLEDWVSAPGFCMHLDNEKATAASKLGHWPWMGDRAPGGQIITTKIPDRTPCFGRANRLTYQLTRVLTRHLINGFSSLEEVHKVITAALSDLNSSCLICGTPKNTRLQRSAPCNPSCSTVFLNASLEVRLAEIRHDPAALDCLLTMVHYAAASQKKELLPECPFPSTLEVARAFSRIPRISSLSNVDDLTTSIKKLAHPAEQLLSWACLSYGGFLVSATGKMRIPGMPANTHQFLLASARPDLEAAFQRRFGSGPTRVLWHGTYMERLFAILSEGLKICSHTTLQLHGAASGAGIYTATEPGTSWGYSAAPAANWSGSTIKGVRVLLGLEAAGAPANIASTVHVVTDAQSLMVRYVFLVPSSAVIPAAANVAPAMLSAYSSLRSGVL